MSEVLKVGDIVSGTWGYSMTIPEFAVVTRRTAKTVWFKKIRKNRANMFGSETPILPVVVDDVKERRAKIRNFGDGERFDSGHASMSGWSGNGVYANYLD